MNCVTIMRICSKKERLPTLRAGVQDVCLSFSSVEFDEAYWATETLF